MFDGYIQPRPPYSILTLVFPDAKGSISRNYKSLTLGHDECLTIEKMSCHLFSINQYMCIYLLVYEGTLTDSISNDYLLGNARLMFDDVSSNEVP